MSLSINQVTRLQYQLEALNDLIKGLTEVDLKIRVKEDKWSAFENIVHLAAYQPLFIKRIEWLLQGSDPVFSSYLADNDPLFHACLHRSLDEVLVMLTNDRREIIRMMTDMGEDQLTLAGTHPKFGQCTVPEWTEFFLLHEAHHLFTIFQLLHTFR